LRHHFFRTPNSKAQRPEVQCWEGIGKQAPHRCVVEVKTRSILWVQIGQYLSTSLLP
jgi:hypothetical protein